jgi:hypothetical protein
LTWCAIDGHDGTRWVAGKQRRPTRLPLPQEGGDAMRDSAEPQRPRLPSTPVLRTVTAPLKLASPPTIAKRAARARQRADGERPISGAHVLRHAAATPRRRQGASWPASGAGLRPSAVETTAHDAKGERALRQEVARAWPEAAPGSGATALPPWPCAVPRALPWHPSQPPGVAWRGLLPNAGRRGWSPPRRFTGHSSPTRQHNDRTGGRP